MSSSPNSNDLGTLRAEIAKIDDQLLQLFAQRLELAKAVGVHKLESGLPIKDYRVEKEVVDRSRRRARELHVSEEVAEDLTQLCIRHAVQVQDELKAARQKAPVEQSQRQRILIVGGLGQMGRWLAEFFESFGHELLLLDSTQPAHFSATTKSWLSEHSAHIRIVSDLENEAVGADIIILSTPMTATAAIIDRLINLAPRLTALVFDICSLKSPLLTTIAKARQAGLRITSVHPMFGPSARLLSGRNILICDCGDHAATKAAEALFHPTTAVVRTLALEQHDVMMSQVLGLSHFVNLLFARVLRASGLSFDELQTCASTTFNAQITVTQPVALENQDLYFEIQSQNRHSTTLLRSIKNEVDLLTNAIAQTDRTGFKNLMAESAQFFPKRQT